MDVIIITNNTELASQLSGIMSSLDLTHKIQYSGQESVEELTKTRHGLILLDNNLPDMSGIEILRNIREQYDETSLPVIIFGDADNYSEIEKAIDFGVTDFFLTPLQTNYVTLKIKKCLKLRETYSRIREIYRQRQDIFNFLPVASIVTDESGVIREMNHKAKKLFPIEKTKNINQLCGEIFGCKHAIHNKGKCGTMPVCADCIIRQSINTTFRDKININQKEGKFNRYINNKLKTFIFLVSTTRIESYGEILSVLTIEDITKQRKIEKTLKQSEQKFKQLFENSQIGIGLSRLDGSIVNYNKALLDIHGVDENSTTADYQTKDFYKNPKDRLRFLTELKQKGKVKNFEAPFKKVSGETIYLNINSDIVEINNEKLILTTQLDITEQRNAQKALKASEEKYRLLVENQAEGFGITNFDEEFIYTNPAAEKIFEVKKGELTGKSILDFLDENQKIFVKKQSELRQTASTNTYELVLNLANSRQKPILVTATPYYNKKNEIKGTMGIFRDISEIKEKENKLKKYAQDLQESNATKDTLFSIIAHDLKNPVSSLLGLSEVLLQKHNRLEPERRERIISSIHNSTKSTFKLLENLLTWSRAQSNQIEINKTRMNVDTFIQKNIRLVQPLADKKNININQNIEKDLFAHADISTIDTVLRNLLTNALKFTNREKNINISAIKKQNHSSEYIEFCVEDEGIGMSEEKVNKLFKVKKNISTQGTENEPGTGLGLIICKDFVEKNDGEIWAESKQNKGSRFYFTLRP